jgi:hypothetical protein
MKPLSHAAQWSMLLFLVCALAGCIGFNKNGFYCTEGPTEVAPPCFGRSAEAGPSSPASTTSLDQPEVTSR